MEAAGSQGHVAHLSLIRSFFSSCACMVHNPMRENWFFLWLFDGPFRCSFLGALYLPGLCADIGSSRVCVGSVARAFWLRAFLCANGRPGVC